MLDELWPQPLLVPMALGTRPEVLRAEHWGQEVLQPVPRRLGRSLPRPRGEALGRRAWGLPAPGLMARLSSPAAATTPACARATAAGRRSGSPGRLPLPPQPARARRRLLAKGVLSNRSANAAALQVLSSVRGLAAFADLRGLLDRPCGAAARDSSRLPGAVPRLARALAGRAPDRGGAAHELTSSRLARSALRSETRIRSNGSADSAR